MQAKTIDNTIIISSTLGGTLGNRQDAVVRKMVPVMEQELEVAA